MVRVAILPAALVGIAVFTGVSVAAGGPMADAGLDQTVTVDTAVQLDGTGSGHPDGPLSAYEWTIRTPDGREIEPDCRDCERSQFTPSVVGRYEVTLTVTGPEGAQNTDTLYVYVQDAGPDVQLSGDRTPDPSEEVTYSASAESPDAELAEIAWAVEDEIIAVRSLDGASDESELSIAFSETETHRIQVVVRDANGRTAYDQLYVQPQSGSSSPEGWEQVESLDCSDSGYAARNSEECWDLDEPESPPAESESSSPEIPDPPSSEIRYRTDGYESMPFARLNAEDSSYMGRTTESIGLDDGENAPWRQGTMERFYDATVGETSRLLFGQDEETVTCELNGGDRLVSQCAQKARKLETTGETSNVYSPSEGGAYEEYGLTGGERVRGPNPTDLEDGQPAEVTIVLQQEEDGIVDRVVETGQSSAVRLEESVDGLFGDDEAGQSTSQNRETDSSSNDRSDDSSLDTGLLTGGIDGLQSGTGIGTTDSPSSSDSDTDTDTTDSTTNSPGPSGGARRGLMR